jgi:hypothetical protein
MHFPDTLGRLLVDRFPPIRQSFESRVEATAGEPDDFANLAFPVGRLVLLDESRIL